GVRRQWKWQWWRRRAQPTGSDKLGQGRTQRSLSVRVWQEVQALPRAVCLERDEFRFALALNQSPFIPAKEECEAMTLHCRPRERGDPVFQCICCEPWTHPHDQRLLGPCVRARWRGRQRLGSCQGCLNSMVPRESGNPGVEKLGQVLGPRLRGDE